jgi:hypothetical protein
LSGRGVKGNNKKGGAGSSNNLFWLGGTLAMIFKTGKRVRVTFVVIGD